jgi:hypothetical protein
MNELTSIPASSSSSPFFLFLFLVSVFLISVLVGMLSSSLDMVKILFLWRLRVASMINATREKNPTSNAILDFGFWCRFHDWFCPSRGSMALFKQSFPSKRESCSARSKGRQCTCCVTKFHYCNFAGQLQLPPPQKSPISQNH